MDMAKLVHLGYSGFYGASFSLSICIITALAEFEQAIGGAKKLAEFGMMNFAEDVSVPKTTEQIHPDGPFQNSLRILGGWPGVTRKVYLVFCSWQNHWAIGSGIGQLVTHVILWQRHGVYICSRWISRNILHHNMKAQSWRLPGILKVHGKAYGYAGFEAQQPSYCWANPWTLSHFQMMFREVGLVNQASPLTPGKVSINTDGNHRQYTAPH
jgi:hypothetical protein